VSLLVGLGVGVAVSAAVALGFGVCIDVGVGVIEGLGDGLLFGWKLPRKTADKPINRSAETKTAVAM
jgi:hypothetical protein